MAEDNKTLARKWALQNAVRYNGKAQLGAVIAKLIGDQPKLKAKLKELQPELKKVVAEVNKLSVAKQRAELEKIAPELLEEKPKEEKKELKPLPKAKAGKVVMRLAPSPSGPLHVGHAYVLGLTAAYCKRYKGKLLLRIEDTNPDNVYPPAYQLLEKDAQWLTGQGVHKVLIQSDRLHTYYDYGEKLIAAGKAYVCTCDPDIWRTMIMEKKPCPCRELSTAEQHARWDKMFAEFEPGQAVVRIKTSVTDPNPAMRDWPAFRINHHVHPRQKTKHRVWPLMNLSVAIDDHENGITHTIRGKDHKDNEKRQKYIYDAFGWTVPEHMYVGRINFTDLSLSATEMRKGIEYEKYTDWDDPRLPTLLALRRRGYQPEALLKYAEAMGLHESDKTLPAHEFFKILDAFNREIIEPKADRYFFVWDPVTIDVANAPPLKPKLSKHPSFPKRGSRTIATGSRFYIAKDDKAKLKSGKVYRLMDCLNFTWKNKNGKVEFHSQTHADYEKAGAAGIMHWLPADTTAKLAKVKVRLPNNDVLEGLGEPDMLKLKPRAIVQLVRKGFCRLDDKHGEKLEFLFAHR